MGALVVLVAVQLSVLGLYLPPVFKVHLTIHCSTPDDHFTAGPDCRVSDSARGALAVVVAVHVRHGVITRVGNFRKSVDNLP